MSAADTHETIRERLADDDIDDEVRAHLTECESCTAFHRTLTSMLTSAAALGTVRQARDESLVGDIAAAVRADARSRQRRRLAGWASVAAVVVVAVGVATLRTDQPSHDRLAKVADTYAADGTRFVFEASATVALPEMAPVDDVHPVVLRTFPVCKAPPAPSTQLPTGADLNGKAAQDAARQVRERLAACAAARYGGAAADVRFANDMVHVGGREIGFATLVGEAYVDRVQLWSDGFYATPGLSWDKDKMQGRPFYYFAYGAAVSEVVVDTLTGEWKLLRADVLHDAGKSLNPAVDIGQVEGAFIQGMGWLTMEELVWHPQSGKLMTHAPSTYKIPTANDCPPVFNVRLFDGRNAEDSIHRSKAVGEPPLLLPFSVFFAIRDAVSAVGGHRASVPLRAPATSEAILNAIEAVQAA